MPSQGKTDLERPEAPADSSALPEPVELPQRIVKALEAFAAAARGRHVEAICAAYQGLQSAANGMGPKQLLLLADKTIGRSAADLVVSAFSHCNCFMCTDGVVACDVCEGKGTVDTDEPCANCASLGLVRCSFCEGTSWAGSDVIPHELRQAVWQRRLARAGKALRQFARDFCPAALSLLGNAPASERHRMVRRAIRLEARLRNLARDARTFGPDQHEHLVTTAQKLHACLEMVSQR